MSLTITTGAKSLFSLGVSVSDIALLYKYGRKVGNFLSASKNEQELFESLMESDGPQTLLKRDGLIYPVTMESRYPCLEFIYQGSAMSNAAKPKVASKQELTGLSWLMIIVVSAFDICLPRASVHALVVEVFTSLLTGDDQVEEALRVQLDTLIQSWRDVAGVRKRSTHGGSISVLVGHEMLKSRGTLIPCSAIPQLNAAEFEEAKQFMIWLMEGKTHDFSVVSATVFAIASAIRAMGVHINTKGDRAYETQPLVRYSATGFHFGMGSFDSEEVLSTARGAGIMAQLVTYPRLEPQSMIDTLGVPREQTNQMLKCWELGCRAADKKCFRFIPSSQTPFTPASEVYYTIEDNDPAKSRTGVELSMLAGHAFPRDTQGIIAGIEEVVRGISPQRITWLSQHTGLEFLLRTQSSKPTKDPANMAVWLSYQALVFGFYYTLLAQLVDFSFVADDTFMRGIWGLGSTTFLAACSQFGQGLRDHQGVSRTHVIYMLSSMYGGRSKLYTPTSTQNGLVGVLGSISVLTMPLLRVTDDPDTISRFAVVELPIVDLASDNNGELLSAVGCDVPLSAPPQMYGDITPVSPTKEWSVHARMGTFVGEEDQRVVMAARCNGRLIGSFSPLAADVAFLSTTYVREKGSSHRQTIQGFEITDQDWQNSCAIQPSPETNSTNVFGVVHSKGCPSLRYAAAGIYLSKGEEISIANGDLDAAFGRIEMQESGIVIA